jgi:hypothetical protein
MLTKEMKLQVFLKLRSENYRASLRLEGLVPTEKTDAETSMERPASPLKTKHER